MKYFYSWGFLCHKISTDLWVLVNHLLNSVSEWSKCVSTINGLFFWPPYRYSLLWFTGISLHCSNLLSHVSLQNMYIAVWNCSTADLLFRCVGTLGIVKVAFLHNVLSVVRHVTLLSKLCSNSIIYYTCSFNLFSPRHVFLTREGLSTCLSFLETC